MRTRPNVAHPCQRDQVVGLDRCTTPQPRSTVCPACFISNGTPDTAYLTLGEDFAARTIVAIGIEVRTDEVKSRIELGALALTPTTTTTVTLPADAVAANSTAIIHVTFADGDTQSKEISIY